MTEHHQKSGLERTLEVSLHHLNSWFGVKSVQDKCAEPEGKEHQVHEPCLKSTRELRNGAATSPAVPRLCLLTGISWELNYLVFCCRLWHLCTQGCFLLSPVWAASISWALPPALGCPRLWFPFLISGQCYLAKYFWPPPHCIPCNSSRNGIHLFTLRPGKSFSHGLFFHPGPGETAVLSHPAPSHPWEAGGSQGTYLLLLQADKCQDFKANSSWNLCCTSLRVTPSFMAILWCFPVLFESWAWTHPKITCPWYSLEERKLQGDFGDFGTWRRQNWGFWDLKEPQETWSSAVLSSLYFHIFRYFRNNFSLVSVLMWWLRVGGDVKGSLGGKSHGKGEGWGAETSRDMVLVPWFGFLRELGGTIPVMCLPQWQHSPVSQIVTRAGTARSFLFMKSRLGACRGKCQEWMWGRGSALGLCWASQPGRAQPAGPAMPRGMEGNAREVSEGIMRALALPICPLLSLKIPLFVPFVTCNVNIFHSHLHGFLIFLITFLIIFFWLIQLFKQAVARERRRTLESQDLVV